MKKEIFDKKQSSFISSVEALLNQMWDRPSSSSMLSCLVDIIKYPPGRRIRFISNRSLPPEKVGKFNLFFYENKYNLEKLFSETSDKRQQHKPLECQGMLQPPQCIASKLWLGKGSLLLPKGLITAGKPRSSATWAKSTRSFFKPSDNVKTSLSRRAAAKLESVHPMSRTTRIFLPHSMSGTIYKIQNEFQDVSKMTAINSKKKSILLGNSCCNSS